jgi:hypothetical protein
VPAVLNTSLTVRASEVVMGLRALSMPVKSSVLIAPPVAVHCDAAAQKLSITVLSVYSSVDKRCSCSYRAVVPCAAERDGGQSIYG